MHFSKVAMAVDFNSHSLEKVNVNMQHRELRLENPAVVLNHFRKKSGAFPGAFPPYKIEGLLPPVPSWVDPHPASPA